MALSNEQRRLLGIALGDSSKGEQIADIIDAGGNSQGVAVANIASPSLADAEDCANKINELLASLRAASIIA